MVNITSAFVLSALALVTSAVPLERRIAQNTPDSKAPWEAACASLIFIPLPPSHNFSFHFLCRMQPEGELIATKSQLLLLAPFLPLLVLVNNRTLPMP